MTPKESVRQKCIECVHSIYQPDTCQGDKMIGQGDANGRCYFFPFRNGKGQLQSPFGTVQTNGPASQ